MSRFIKFLGNLGFTVRRRVPESTEQVSESAADNPSKLSSKPSFRSLLTRDDLLGVLARELEEGVTDYEDGQTNVLKSLKAYLKDKPDYSLKAVRTENGESIAHIAARYGLNDVLEFVLDKDKSLVNARDDQGETPLLRAVDVSRQFSEHMEWESILQDHLNCIRTLLTHRANPNDVGFSGETALHVLLSNRNKLERDNKSQEILLPVNKEELDGFLYKASSDLIRKGADVNAKTKDNATPVYEAVTNYADIDLVGMLLHAGADPTIKSERPVQAIHGKEIHKGMDAIEAGKAIDYPHQGKLEYLVMIKNKPPVPSPDPNTPPPRKRSGRNPDGTIPFSR